MKKLSIAYFGTPDFSAHVLERIMTDPSLPVAVSFVVTQGDKPVGRRQILTPSPVKLIAQKYNIPLVNTAFVILGRSKATTPESVHQDPGQARMTDSVDLALLFAYGEIIPPDVLRAPRHGFWNIHPSLLPRYRGPSPVASAIIAGERQTGVTLMKMTEQVDAGPIIAQEVVKIGDKERTPELTMRLADRGYELFKNSINVILASDKGAHPESSRSWTSQDDTKATYTKRFTKQDGYIEMSKFKAQMSNQPAKLFNFFRGLYPWPGLWSVIRVKGEDKRLKITDMDLVGGKLIIRRVQLEGKREVDFATFNRVYEVF